MAWQRACEESYAQPAPRGWIRRRRRTPTVFTTALATLRPHKKTFMRRSIMMSRTILKTVLSAHTNGHRVGPLLILAARNCQKAVNDYRIQQAWVQKIHCKNVFNFNSFSNEECLLNFRFTKDYVVKIVKVVGFGWYVENYHTDCNRYITSPILSTWNLFGEWLNSEEERTWSRSLL